MLCKSTIYPCLKSKLVGLEGEKVNTYELLGKRSQHLNIQMKRSLHSLIITLTTLPQKFKWRHRLEYAICV